MTSAAIAVSDAIGFDRAYLPASRDGLDVARWQQKVLQFRAGTAADWLPVIYASIAEIAEQCGTPDWDEPGSVPVTSQTRQYAQELATALALIVPAGTPPPDILPETDGDISLDWSVSKDRVFSLSVGPHGKVSYSGLFGSGGSAHGWEPLGPDVGGSLESVATGIAKHLRRLYCDTTRSGR
jgi:hypothetical protein